ncbi:hypothetical protein WEH80_32800 [Actinomycetes bacterium KLBMP 9759]
MVGLRLGWRIVALLSVAVVAAGCAQSMASPGPASGLPQYFDIHELVTAVTTQQRIDRTAQLHVSGEITGPTPVTFTGSGALQVLDGGVSVAFTQSSTTAGGAPQETGFVVLPDSVYVRQATTAADTAARTVKKLRPWVKADPKSTDPAARELTALAATLVHSADPIRSLARFADASLIADVDDDVVNSVPATRYTIVVDMARAAAQQTDPGLREQLAYQVRNGLSRVTSTLWLDGGNRPVRSALRQDLPGVGLVTLTGDFVEWGKPVSIEPPPATELR